MDDFLRSFKSVRDTPHLVPSSNKGFPPELHQLAKDLVKTSRHKYSVLPIIDIIITNLKRGKSIQDIKEGLVSISKYPLCLYLDQDRPEFHQIRTFSGFYTYELKEKLDSFEQILEALGYRYDAPSQLYKLDEGTRASATFDDTIAKIGCDLVLALEELDLYIEMSKDNHIDPIVHFSSRVPQLQQNYEPAEIQYPNPAIPPRIPNQQNYATQNFRNDTQNQYSNMPNKFQNPQAMHRAHIPESTRFDAPNSYDQHRGVYQGTRMPYTPQDTNLVYPAPNQQKYQVQEQPYNPNSAYTKADPFPHNQQTTHQGQVQQLYGQDPIPVQAPYVRQEVNIRPTYPPVSNYNPNPGIPRQPGQDFTRPTNPAYGKSDPFSQAQHTQEPVYANNYNHGYKQPMSTGQDPYANISQDAYASNTAAPYANSGSYTTEPAHTPDTGYGRAATNPEAVDIRYTQNPELAEADVLPPRRPKPNLTQGIKEFSQRPVEPLGNVPTSKSTDQLNTVNSARDAGNDSSELKRQHLIQYAQPEPIKDTGRDAGITQRGQMYIAPPDTPNKPQEFQLNSSRDADERNTGNQQAAMYGNRDASGTHNQTESFLLTQDSTGQPPGTVIPRYYDKAYVNQGLGVFSSTSRGVASPNVQPKNTHDLDERTRDQSEDKGDFKTKAFAKSESSELHESDEKRISREHQFSGVKEQGSNSPRQLSPKPANYSGKKETGGLQAADTQQPFQPYGTQYDNHPYQQQPPANPGTYPIEETRRPMPAPNISDYSQGVGSTPNPMNKATEAYQGYDNQEYPPANPGAYPIEETRRPMPAPNISDYSQGVGSTPNPMNKATEAYQGYDNQEYPPANPGAYPIEETRRPMPAPNISDYSQGVGSTPNPMNKATEAYQGYDNQEYPPANPGAYPREMGDPRGTDMSDYTKGIDNMHMAIRPPDDYPGYNPHERTPANPGAYPGQIEETHRPVPAYTDFSKGVDSTQYHTRPEQPPTAQDGGYTNEPYKHIDDGAYPIPVNPYRDELRNPRVRVSPKDDFSQAVSDKNTGINDPNPVRNNPPVHNPRHRDDPGFTDLHDYRTEHHDDIPSGDDGIMMMDMGERDKVLQYRDRKNIADMQRVREHVGYEDPPYHPRQQHMEPTYHRPYEQPFQPPALPPAPTTEWECPHCTYVNNPGIRVCTICSKTPGSIAEKAAGIPPGTTKCKSCMMNNPSTARLCVGCKRGLFD